MNEVHYHNLYWQTVQAMHRRLDGQFKQPIFGEDFDRSETRADRVCERGEKVKKEFERERVEAHVLKEELANAYPENGLPMSLAKTLAVVALTRRVWNPNAFQPYPFSDNLRAIQEDLLSSIRIILNCKRIGSGIEKELRKFLAPVSCFKRALLRWLFEFLMECSEIRRIPESLEKAIAIITDPEKQPVPRRKRASNDKMKGTGQKAKKSIKSRNKVQGSATKKKKKDTLNAPTIEEVLIQDRHARRVIKRKLIEEITEESKKAKRPRKLLKKSKKKKIEEEQCNSANSSG